MLVIPLQARHELNGLIARLGPRQRYQKATLNSRQITATVRNFFKPRIVKPFLIIHLFNIFQAFCGLGIFTYYTVDILSKTRKPGTQIMDDYSTTVLVSGVRVVTVLVSSFLMLKVGRRTLAMTSGVLSSISALCLGTLLCLNSLEFGSPIPPQTEAKITFGLILIYAGGMSFGFFGLPSVMIGETQPAHVRGFACGYIYTINDLLLGGVVKMYPWMSSSLQIHGLFFFFGISCVLCTIYVYMFLPETQGLTLQQIEDYFRKPNVMWINRNKCSDRRTECEDIDVDSISKALD
jgi:SP family facilitated glucose transporter-like MFS transporter 8